MENKIKDILNDSEFWQPQMIIEEQDPFYWRLNPKWVEEKTKAIMNLIKESTEGLKKGITFPSGEVDCKIDFKQPMALVSFEQINLIKNND